MIQFKDMIMKLFILLLSVLSWSAFATFSEKGMLRMDHQWWECSQGGTVIQCKTEECDGMCRDILQKEKEEKEADREDKLQIMLDDTLNVETPEKNPALFQVH